MRVLITTGIFPPDIGGPASYSRALAYELSNKHGVTVMTYAQKFWYPDDRQLPFQVIRIFKKLPKGLRHLRYFISAWYAASRHDVVFALNAVSAGVPACIAARWNRRKFFVKIVGDYAWEIAIHQKKTPYLMKDFQKFPRTGWIGVLHRLQTWVCRNADRVIVPSEFLAEVVRGWGIDGSKVVVIYNGADFQPAELTREEARKQIGLIGNLIVSAGRLVPWKGFRMLIKIMPQLLAINQVFRLVIVGDGPERGVLESMVKNLHLERKVFLVGTKSPQELAVYLAAADIFVLNTGYEGFSHQLLEVMLAGVPIVTTAVGGNREIIKQGKNGFLIKYNDEFNLIEAIKTLWKIPDMREQFISEAKETVKKFSAPKMLTETVEILTA